MNGSSGKNNSGSKKNTPKGKTQKPQGSGINSSGSQKNTSKRKTKKPHSSGTSNRGLEKVFQLLTYLSTLLTFVLLVDRFVNFLTAINNTRYSKFVLWYVAGLTIILLSISLWNATKKRNKKQIWFVLFLYFLLLAIGLSTIPRIEDWLKKFNEDDISVIICDFRSPNKEDGHLFANKLYDQVLNKIPEIKDSLSVLFDGKQPVPEIKIKRVYEVWDSTKIKVRARRRQADFGITGEYDCYDADQTIQENVRHFRMLILNTTMAPVLRTKIPYRDGFFLDFESLTVTLRDTVKLTQKTASPIEYIINMTGNTILLRRAITSKNWERDKTLNKLHNRLAQMGELIQNPALAAFHHGNSLIKVAIDPKLELNEQRYLYKAAIKEYVSSIDSVPSESSQSVLKQQAPWRTYLNLALTFHKLDSLCTDSTYQLEEGKTLARVARQFPNRETLQEYKLFLDVRCEELIVNQKDTLKIPQAELLYKKYELCVNALEMEIRDPSKPHPDKDNEILKKIQEDKILYSGHLNRLRELRSPN